MNNRIYVPLRKGEIKDWYQWEMASSCREQVERNLKDEERKYCKLMAKWPLIRIALVEAREVKA